MQEDNKIFEPKTLQQLRELFDSEDTFVVLYFLLDKCAPSTYFKKKLLQQHSKSPQYKLAIVNVEEADRQLSEKFDVEVVPRTFLLRGSIDDQIIEFEGADERQLGEIVRTTQRFSQ